MDSSYEDQLAAARKLLANEARKVQDLETKIEVVKDLAEYADPKNATKYLGDYHLDDRSARLLAEYIEELKEKK